MKTRDEVYNEIIQDYSHLQYELEGDELQDKVNEIVDEIYEEYNELIKEYYKLNTNNNR